MPLRVSHPLFNLPSFEGPLDLLVHLIEKKELDVYEVIIQDVMDQYIQHLNTLMEYDLDISAEFLSVVTSLMLLKSKTLLPKHEESEEISESALRVEILEQLIHYYKFKDLAERLKDQEQQRLKHFSRAYSPFESDEPAPLKKPNSTQLLTDLFLKVLERKKNKEEAFIKEEDYRVSDMIRFIKQDLKNKRGIAFDELFTLKQPKLKLITLFLALLELMKHGFAQVLEQNNQLMIEGVS